MKIVINATYGGFVLSDECIEELARRKGHKAYRYTYGANCLRRCEKTDSFRAFLIDIDKEEVSYEEADQNFFESFFKDGNMRTDLDLISLIEEKGSEWASGWCAALKIIEIPTMSSGPSKSTMVLSGLLKSIALGAKTHTLQKI